jgi:hypothetical protein
MRYQELSINSETATKAVALACPFGKATHTGRRQLSDGNCQAQAAFGGGSE